MSEHPDLVVCVDTPAQKLLARLAPYWKDKEARFNWPPVKNYYEHYAFWSSLVKPDSYLEIGVMYGWSVMAVLAGWPHISRITLLDSELYEIPIGVAKDRIIRFCIEQGIRVPQITAIKCDTTVISELPTGEMFDLMHVDGQHSEFAAHRDLELCNTRLSYRGTIIVDDLKLPGIKAGADRFLAEHPEYDVRMHDDNQTHYLMWRR